MNKFVTVLLASVFGTILFSTCGASEDIKPKKSIWEESKNLVENLKNERLMKARQEEEGAENQIEAVAKYDEEILKEELSLKKGGDEPADLRKIIATQALEAAELRRKFEEMLQRQKTTERQFKQTNKYIKTLKLKWKTVGQTLDAMKLAKKHRQNDKAHGNSKISGNSVGDLLKWIEQADNRITENSKGKTELSKKITTNSNGISANGDRINTNANEIVSTSDSIRAELSKKITANSDSISQLEGRRCQIGYAGVVYDQWNADGTKDVQVSFGYAFNYPPAAVMAVRNNVDVSDNSPIACNVYPTGIATTTGFTAHFVYYGNPKFPYVGAIWIACDPH